MIRIHNRRTTMISLLLAGGLYAACSRDSSIRIPDAMPYEGSNTAMPLPNDADAKPITSESGSEDIGTSPSIPGTPTVDPVVVMPPTEPVVTTPPVVTEPVVTPPVVTPPVVTPPVVTPPVVTPTPVPPMGAIANGEYSFQGVSSGKCIDVSNGQTWDGLQMQIWDCMNNEPNQNFKVEWVSGNYYRISTRGGKALQGRKNGLNIGSPFQQGTYAGEDHQLFAIESTGNPGKYYLKSKLNNLVVDLAGDFRANGSYLQFAAQVTAGYQQWVLLKR